MSLTKLPKRRRLPNGLDELPSGRIRARYRDTEGKQYSRSFVGIREATKWRTVQLAAVDMGSHVAPNDRTTVLDYAWRWTEGRAYKELSIRQGTTYLNHVRDTPLGNTRIKKVLPSDVQSWVQSKSRMLAPQTMRNLYTWLKAVFAAAVEDRLITYTPCTSKISLPTIPRPRIVPLTVDQVRLLSEAMPDRYSTAVIMQAALGLRVSELLGLQTTDVDFLRRTVAIDRQLARDGRRFVPPKTESSRRTVPLAADVTVRLSQHIAEYPPNADGVLFTTTKANPIRQDFYTARLFQPARQKAGLPDNITTHDLRHHFASVLISKGLPVNVVAHYLGHSTATLVLTTYAHLMPDSDDLTRQAIEESWSVSPDVSRRQASTI